MSQSDFGVIDPFVVNGEQLAGMLNNWRDAVHSWHRGAVRPAYIVPGMMWIDDSGGTTAWVVKVYISAALGDRALFTYNTLTGAIDFTAAATNALASTILLTQAAADPSVRWNNTGNAADAKAWRATTTATGALRIAAYTDAGVQGAYIEFARDGKVTADLTNATNFATGSTVLNALAPQVAMNVVNQYFNGPTTGAIGAAGQKWLLVGSYMHSSSSSDYFETRIWNGAAAVNPQNAVLNAPANINFAGMLQAIATLAGPTTFTLQSRNLISANGLMLVGSTLSAIRLS